MKVLIDVNVFLDVFQQREPFYPASAAVLDRVVRGDLSGCLAGHALTTVYFLVARHSDRKTAEKSVDWLLGRFDVVPAAKETYLRARTLGFADYEDGVTAACAEAAGCDRIVSRNVADFTGSPVAAVTPEELITLLSTPPP